ncbi:MAG: molybdenum cofactor guanylyltransferase [Porticoccaceae bacterium]|nr:molybdenum cofactor guanylyltransferase [Porticoccaceae bacterium]
MTNIDGVILAAGRSSRMGKSNKVQSQLAGRTLLDHVRDRLEPQVDQLIVNGDPAICGEAAVVDVIDGAKGPLVGLYSALVSEQLSAAEFLMMVPCDGPFIPTNLVAELYRDIQLADADIACVRYGGVAQPTFSLWHKRVTPAVEQALLVKKQGGFKPLLASLDSRYLDWPEQVVNPFFNINTQDDLAEAEALLCL